MGIFNEQASWRAGDAGNYVYKNGELEFFNQPEGYVEKDDTGYTYVYQYKDHLQNIRISYTDINNDGSITDNEIIEEKNYYPFGLQHKGYNNTLRRRKHSYGFSSKEEQNELGLGWVDITARNYETSLGRWMNLDPLSEIMRRHSPYNYAFDNPIYFVDSDGMIAYGNGGGGNRRGLNGPLVNLRRAAVRKAKSIYNTVKTLITNNTSQNLVLVERATSEIREIIGSDNPIATTGSIAKDVYDGIGPQIEQIAKEENISKADAAGVWVGGIGIDVGIGLATDGVLSGLSKGTVLVDDLVFTTSKVVKTSSKSRRGTVSDFAKKNGIFSGQNGLDSSIVDNYLDQMRDGSFDVSLGAGGFIDESGSYILTEGNHKMNAAIEYGLETGDLQYAQGLIDNGSFSIGNPSDYGYKIYDLPTR